MGYIYMHGKKVDETLLNMQLIYTKGIDMARVKWDYVCFLESKKGCVHVYAVS